MNNKDIISKMTIEEKASLCSGKDAWNTNNIDRLGIEAVTVADGPHGVRKVKVSGDLDTQNSFSSTCFPTASALSSTWNYELVEKVGAAIAEEAINLDIDILLAPGVNMKRSPLCGRNFEYFSESIWLTSIIGSAFVKGVQRKGVGTSLKHFACNNQEHHRMSLSAEMDERTLRETYLRAFELIIKNAKPWTVMSSYNKINGEYSSENEYLLNDILREEWGYKGVVVSDWGAVNDRVKGLEAGLDLQMPGPADWDDKKIIESVIGGKLDEEKLDKAVGNILNLVHKCKKTEKIKIPEAEIISENKKLAVIAARESMVLLKNEGGILPLNKNNEMKIAVIGRFAKYPRYQGKGSSQINSTEELIPLIELKKIAGEMAEITYSQGYEEKNILNSELENNAVKDAGKADIVLFFAGLPDWLESEGYDRENTDLPDNQICLIKKVSEVNKNMVLILNSGAAITFDKWIDEIPAVLEVWLIGQGSGKAVSEIIFGEVNPSGRLSETFPLKNSHNPSYLNFPGEMDKVFYNEGIYTGYKYYQKKEIPVRFPFGFGLSYTEFEYCVIDSDKYEYDKDEIIDIEVEIKNIGDYSGKEVIQLYIHPKNYSIDRPIRELRGVKKIYLIPGEKKTVKFSLNREAFEYFNPYEDKWIVEDGEYEIQIGSSCEDIKLSKTVKINSDESMKNILNGFSTVREWFENEKGREVVKNTLPDMYRIFEDVQDDGGDDFIRMIYGASMINPAEIICRHINKSPEDLIEDLLREIE